MRIRIKTSSCVFVLALLACSPAFAGCPTINGEFETTSQQLDGEDGLSISSDTPALFGVYKRISQSPNLSPLSGD